MDGTRWVTSKHPTNPHYKKHYLTDVEQLSELFRKKFTRGPKRLYRKGEIDYTPPPLPDEDDPRSVGYQETFAEWADRTGDRDWCVHIEPPPQNSTPEHALKYLARYLNGGPISDGRLISHEDGDVTFWARNRRGKSRPFKLSGTEFVRRWSLHISPPGLTRSRPYFHSWLPPAASRYARTVKKTAFPSPTAPFSTLKKLLFDWHRLC